MKIIKPFQLGLMSRTFVKDRKYYLSAASLAFFPFHNPEALGTEQEMWEAIPNLLGSNTIFDLCMPKIQGEVLILGNCYAPKNESTKQLYVDFKMGSVLKRLVVTGDRFWKKGLMAQGLLGRLVDNDWEPSEPIPFTEMNIDWKNSFGGEGFIHNPLGKGFVPKGEEPSADETSPLPNVERIDSLAIEPQYDAIPGGYGPIDHTWPARSRKLGKKYDKNWEKNRYPEPAVDMIQTYYNAAPPDQQLKQNMWEYGEEFIITNMHPKESTIKSSLPKIRQKCFVLQRENDSERWNEISLIPETVWLFPNIKKGILISRGVYEVDTFYGVDVDTILLAWELKNGKARTAEDYRKSLQLREDKETRSDWLIRQDDLSPAEGIPEEEDIFEKEDELDQSERYKPVLEKITADVNLEIAKMNEKAASLGLDPSKFAKPIEPLKYPEIPKLKKMSDVPKLFEFAKNEEAKLLKEIADGPELDSDMFMGETKEKAKKKIMDFAKDVCKKTGQDHDALMANAKANPASTDSPVQQIKQLLKEGKKKLAEYPEQSKEQTKQIDIALGKLDNFEQEIEKSNSLFDIEGIIREGAHYEDKTEELPPTKQQEIRAWIVQKHAEEYEFFKEDLKGADLSNLELKGIKFNRASLDDVDFTNTDLTGAIFIETSLARANLTKAKISTALILKSNLGKANFTSATLNDSKLEEVILEDTLFCDANLENSAIQISNGINVNFKNANLTKANLTEADLMESTLENAILIESDFSDANLMSTCLSGANLSNATLTNTSMIEVTARKAIFISAKMENTNIHQDSIFENANFFNISSKEINFSSTNLRFANFENAYLEEANFGESTLQGANFKRVYAREADFTDADLSDADMSESDFMGASFQSSILIRTNFTNSHLFEADFMFSQRRETISDNAVIKRTNFLE